MPRLRRVVPGASRTAPPTRRLKFSSRVRKRFRGVLDRVLGAHWGWSAAFILVVTLLGVFPPRAGDPRLPEVGQPADRDIVAPRDILVLDEERVSEERARAAEAVPDVYTHDPARGARLARELRATFEEGRRRLEAGSLEAPGAEAGEKTRLSARIPADTLRWLVARGFDRRLEDLLASELETVLSGRVVASKAVLERRSEIRLVGPDGGPGRIVDSFGEFFDRTEARRRIVQRVARELALDAAEQDRLEPWLDAFVDASVQFDPEATAAARREASERVDWNFKRVARKGDVLAHAGQTITTEVVALLDRSRPRAARAAGAQWLGMFLVSSMLAFFVFRYAQYHQRAFRKLNHLHALLVLVLLSLLVLSWGALRVVAELVVELDPPFDRLQSYAFLVPLAAGPILVTLLANGRIATVHAAFASFLFGATNGWDPYLMVWAMLVQCAGVYAISTYRERAALLRAGLVVGAVGAIAAFAMESLEGLSPGMTGRLVGPSMAFVGGAVGVGLLSSFSLPLLERLFNVLTDIRLLELSNINNPLLSEMAVRAPGSYNHSLVVGTLAEEGAKAVGANSLLCRVAAFYHDIGKMNKPEYFVENQRGVNPHDRLSPSMSALIIAAHVKDGIKMAREAGLPEQIVDIIPQHHGTRLMTFFHEKAKSSTDPALGSVKDEEFRYPGPKPQSREAAIFMLADAVEAAARTIDEPTANRLKEMIRKVTNAIVLDRQLDQCELTFADLEKIQAAFLRCLVSMYHHRVDYPGFDFGRSKTGGKTGESMGRQAIRSG